MIELRTYQRAAVDAVWTYWRKGGGNPLIEVPTGGGKSAILGQLAREIVDAGSRVLIATHRRELIEQDAAACRAVWPDAPIGIYSAGLGSRQVRPITVAGIQSIRKRAAQMGDVGVLMIDEAHLLSPDATTSYRVLIEGLRDINPEMRVVGLTATPYRLGQGYLTQGPDKIFDSIVYKVAIKDLIAQGYLSPLTTGVATTSINLDDVRTNAGDYVLADLELAADVDAINATVAENVTDTLRAGRTSALLFGVSVAHATRMMWAVRTLGISCEVVTGETDQAQRKRILADFKARKLSCISSCDVLTTGFDAPVVDVIALVRPTKSTSLYVQMLGRGMRVAPGKANCVVLDYGANIARHGPVDDVRVPKPKQDGDGKAPFKYCESCNAENPASARVCIECDAPFPEVVRKANEKASKLAVLSVEEKKSLRKRIDVGEIAWHKHVKKSDPDATPTLRIDYYGTGVGLKLASEWICLEHPLGGFAHRRADAWWRANVDDAVPTTIDQAIGYLDDGRMAPVVAIECEPDGEFTRVVKVLQERPRDDAEIDFPAITLDEKEDDDDAIPF